MSGTLRFVMDNAEEILQSLESFSKLKPKEIPKELDDYLGYVAKTGDPVYQWQYVRCLFHEKLAKVITEFYETSPSVDLPPCPNVDPFNYERMKTSLLERLDNFLNAPFTVQRICELLTSPRKQYNRVDKFMRAIEKNILVVSTREPGFAKRPEIENDSVLSVNGVPENKDHDVEGDRVILSHDGMTSNNAIYSQSVTLENAVNSCDIQEEIEINSASSTTVAEEKGWLNSNENKMAVDPASQVSEIEKPEVSTSDITSKPEVVSTSSDLERATTSSFSESSEDKINSEESTAVDQSKLLNVAEAEDSPDSPEPRPDEILCDASSDEDSSSPQKNYADESDYQLREENGQTCEVEVSEKSDVTTEELEQLESVPDSEAVSVVIKSCESLQQIDSTVEQQLSPLTMAPDSSNECFTNDESENITNEGITVTQQEEETIPDTADCITSSQVNIQVQDETVESVSVVSEDSSDTSSKTEELPQVEIPEVEEVSEGNALNDNLLSENECSVLIEEVTDSKEAAAEDEEEEEVVQIASEDCERVAETPVEEEKEVEEEENKVSSESPESSEALEVVGSSTLEVCNEVGEEPEEVESRESGSVIHTTQSICIVEQELDVEAESTQKEGETEKETSEENQVEAICIDQSSCDATSEAEAMDVDDNTSNQMTIGEVEMNEEEPMDQSDQSHA